MFALLLLLTFVSLLVCIYYSTNLKYKYWEKKGVYYVKPTYFFGNMADNIFQKKSIHDTILDLYNSNKNARYIGLYQFFTPTLLIKDIELIKQITIKHFDSFADHHLEASKEADPMWANSILLRTQKSWQETRSKVTPIFTGKKLRYMIPLMQDCTQKLIQYLKLQEKDVDINISEVFRKIQNDVIATVAFGVQLNTLNDENNEFFNLASKASDFSGLRAFIFMGYSLFPTFMKFFRFKMFNKKMCTFFRSLIEESIKVRVQEKIYRPDFIHLLATNENIFNENNIDPSHLKTIIDEITAQSMFFFFAGFETISSVMTFFAYQLAISPDVQEKVYQEVMKTIGNNDDRLTYEAIVSMKYLNNVVLEVLRFYVPTAVTDRKCIKPFTIEPKTPDEQPLTIDQNTCIWIPMRTVHKDPKYFTNPEKFDPERFNTDKIQQCTFIPFGSGPRMCIGERFSMLELKLVFAETIRHYKFVPTEKTEIPLTFKINSFLLKPKNKIWLRIKPRTH